MILSKAKLTDGRTARLNSTGCDAGELLFCGEQPGCCAAPGAPVRAHHQPLGRLFCPRQLGSQSALGITPHTQHSR